MLHFHHWFWITLLTGLQCGLTFSDILDKVNTVEESMPDSERSIVRRVSSFQSQRLGREGKFEVDEEFSTQRSVLVSRVRVEVGGKKLYEKKKNKKVTSKPIKKPKSFLDSLFSKLKSFAKVTLSSREISENLNPFNHLNGIGVSSDNSKRGNESEAFNDNVYNKSESEVATSEYGDSDDKMYLGSESHIGIHTYSHQQESVTSDSNISRKDKILDKKPSLNDGKVVIKQEIESDNVTDTRSRSRSKEARGRSLWGIGRESERMVKEERKAEDESIFSFSNDITLNENPNAIEKEVNIILEQESRVYLLEFSNIIIIIIAVGIFITIALVLTIVLLCRHGLKQPVKSCKQVSDVSSSSFHIPQKTDISYNCQGSRCKQSCLSDELYSLDSDYFLSSLEDIEAQI